MNNLLRRTRTVYDEYPRAFWIYNIIVFVDRLGGFMLYPFFALYLTQKFDIGMSTVGILFAIFSISGMVGSALGGAITDRMGRKVVIIFSLIFSSLSAIGIALAPSLGVFAAVIFFVGVLAQVGHPAHEAVVADVLPPEKRAEGYGIIRVIFNLAVIVAPPLAGLLISNSYLTLFLLDAAISLVGAAIVLLALPETKPRVSAHVQPETMKETFIGYRRVFRDTSFLAFIGVTVMMTLVYMNMNSTLGVYLRDQYGVPELGYGSLISINAIIVVLFQFWVTRRLRRYKPLLMMATGSVLYAIGFAMYGFVASFALFVIAMIIITIGEMIVTPFQQSLVSSFAPENMRGRYMAVSGLSWSISFAVGPYFAGLLLDSASPNLLWAFCGLLGMLAALSFTVLNRVRHSTIPVIEPAAAD